MNALSRIIPGQLEIPGADILDRQQRAGATDRARYQAHLRWAYEHEYLPLEVFKARDGAAQETVTVEQLAILTVDLPPLPEQRAKGLSPVGTRRIRHLLLACACVAWATLGSAAILGATGFPVTYSSGADTWVQTEHPGWAFGLVFMFVFTGIIMLIADIAWWYNGEVAE